MQIEDTPDTEAIEAEHGDAILDDQAAEPEQAQDDAQPEQQQAQTDDAEEVTVSIGDETPADDPGDHLVKKLRKITREREKRIRELEQKLATVEPVQKVVQLGAKPKLEEFDYDADKYEAALDAWHTKKQAVNHQQALAQREQQAQQQAWAQQLDGYTKSKQSLKVRDYEDAELMVQDTLSVTQQGIIVQGAENPALVVYALGKNPKKAHQLAEIADPVKFAFAVAKLEKELKVSQKKPVPPPESAVRNATASKTSSIEGTLDRLREEAAKTGDLSKVLEYKRRVNQQKRA